MNIEKLAIERECFHQKLCLNALYSFLVTLLDNLEIEAPHSILAIWVLVPMGANTVPHLVHATCAGTLLQKLGAICAAGEEADSVLLPDLIEVN